MRYLAGGLMFLGLAGFVFAQQGPGQSIGGFGSILHPGLGHTPITPPGGINGPYFFGNGRSGGSYGRGGGFGTSGFASHPRHSRTVVVPYPIYYGGYGYGYGYGYDPTLGYPPPGYGDQAAPPASENGVPSVVINQNFVPPQASPQVVQYAPAPDTSQDQQQQQSGLKLYQTPPTHPYADQGQTAAPPRRATTNAANDDNATVYLIAFKDHSIVQALGYWMEGSTLHYVSMEHTLNQASMDLIDRELSQRLNDERGVQFRLPPAR
jgi:hypothetical protein